MGTVAAETLEETLALLRGFRVEVEARIADLARIRSAGLLLERAVNEDGGLPENSVVAGVQAGAELVEVRGSPGRLAARAASETESARTGAVESGEVRRPLEAMGFGESHPPPEER